MPRWPLRILRRIHELAAERAFRLTAKADRELAALGVGIDPEDVREVLLGLNPGDAAGRQASRATSEWMYVFKPRLGREILYLKLILRDECVVVSFHEDEGGRHEEDEKSD